MIVVQLKGVVHTTPALKKFQKKDGTTGSSISFYLRQEDSSEMIPVTVPANSEIEKDEEFDEPCSLRAYGGRIYATAVI